MFWRDMGVVNLPSGQPTMRLTGGAAERLKAILPPGTEAFIHLTITDEPPLAQAFVVIEARAEAVGGGRPGRRVRAASSRRTPAAALARPTVSRTHGAGEAGAIASALRRRNGSRHLASSRGRSAVPNVAREHWFAWVDSIRAE